MAACTTCRSTDPQPIPAARTTPLSRRQSQPRERRRYSTLRRSPAPTARPGPQGPPIAAESDDAWGLRRPAGWRQSFSLRPAPFVGGSEGKTISDLLLVRCVTSNFTIILLDRVHPPNESPSCALFIRLRGRGVLRSCLLLSGVLP